MGLKAWANMSYLFQLFHLFIFHFPLPSMLRAASLIELSGSGSRAAQDSAAFWDRPLHCARTYVRPPQWVPETFLNVTEAGKRVLLKEFLSQEWLTTVTSWSGDLQSWRENLESKYQTGVALTDIMRWAEFSFPEVNYSALYIFSKPHKKRLLYTPFNSVNCNMSNALQ